MLMCCHPCLTERARLCLTLKTVGGLSVTEIARALLSTEAATRKMITRAKQRLREEHVPFAFPDPPALHARIDSVLRVLYLLFNEGYSATEGDRLVRADLCDEAIWLTSLFLHDTFARSPRLPTIKALLALMLLQSSRLQARTDEQGLLVVLAEQDRSRWDRERIALGLHFLRESAAGDELSVYHLQAQIAACHAVAPSYEASDGPQILTLYDTLLALSPTPVIALNRAVAVGVVHGPEAGLEALRPLAEDRRLRRYYLLPATFAGFYQKLNDGPRALRYYERARALARTDAEKRFLEKKMADCTP